MNGEKRMEGGEGGWLCSVVDTLDGSVFKYLD